ncbi:hypothetical protein HaLaN_07037 [Haematococcus lacustris]|uniref:Uncharacterized protein n=1 Tax=Haematococcus lacustris TaxID=44745 RepID=A0A699YWY5_HAELA|nr:hypothetical protein HaLaN_07037 [Haematococcus lacustris]
MTSNELTDADMDELMGTSQQPTSKPATCNEVMDMEDIDDIDSLIESEAVRAGLNPELAAKLAAFEAGPLGGLLQYPASIMPSLQHLGVMRGAAHRRCDTDWEAGLTYMIVFSPRQHHPTPPDTNHA